jgi:hypothetical protein
LQAAAGCDARSHILDFLQNKMQFLLFFSLPGGENGTNLENETYFRPFLPAGIYYPFCVCRGGEGVGLRPFSPLVLVKTNQFGKNDPSQFGKNDPSQSELFVFRFRLSRKFPVRILVPVFHKKKKQQQKQHM